MYKRVGPRLNPKTETRSKNTIRIKTGRSGTDNLAESRWKQTSVFSRADEGIGDRGQVRWEEVMPLAGSASEVVGHGAKRLRHKMSHSHLW